MSNEHTLLKPVNTFKNRLKRSVNTNSFEQIVVCKELSVNICKVE